MPRSSSKTDTILVQKVFPKLRRVAQKNIFLCGPATLEMLLSYHAVIVKQKEIVDALNLKNLIRKRGMNIAEMGRYVHENHPELQFWSKFNSTLVELSTIINVYHYPVGIEWQGVFIYDTPQEAAEDDPGHFSIVTDIDIDNNRISIADPYKHFAGTDREFELTFFEPRWWDNNPITNPETNETTLVNDFHALFIITKKDDNFPELLHLNRYQPNP